MANRTVSVALVADVGGYTSQMTRAATATRTVGDQAATAGARAQRGFETASRGARLLQVAAAGAATLGLKAVIDAASAAEQSVGGVQAVFKEYAAAVIQASREADRALGLSENAYRELATVIGSQMKNAGVPMDELAERTSGIIEIGADLAAQFGGSTQQAVEALSSAFRGELDPIERYGISLSATRVAAKAVELGLAESASEISLNAKAMATLALITEQSADAQGAFARESDTAAGRAQRAAAQWENLKVAVGDRLLPAWSALVDVLGTKVIPFLGDVLEVGGDVVGWAMDNQEVVAALAAALAVQLVGGITAVNVAFSRMVLTPAVLGLAGLLTPVQTLTTALGAAGRAIGTFMAAAAPLVAVGSIVYAIAKTVDFANAASDAREEVAGMWEAVDDASGAEKIAALEGVADQIRAKIQGLKADIGDVQTGLMGGLFMLENGADVQALQVYEEELRKVEEATSDVIGTATTLGNWFGLNRQQVLDLADRYDIDLSAGLDNAYVQFQRFYTTAYGDAPGQATRQLIESLRIMGDTAATAEERIDALKTALDILGGATVSVFEAQSALQEAVASATGALEDLTGSVLDGNGKLNAYTEAGRAAGDVLINVRDRGNDLITTMIEQGATIEEVRAADAQLRQSFIESAVQMGISRQAAEDLANEILGVPQERETRFTAATDQASARIAALQAQIDAVSRDRTATINFRATLPDLNGSASGSGRMGTFSNGGYTGPGHKLQPAGVVHAGEIVWSQDDIAAHGGVGAVESMRRARPRGYADGGVVIAGNADTTSVNAGLNAVDMTIANAITATARYLEPATRAAAALQWARSQVGKPYLWGGVGPGGYDCSGFMSAITNYMRGRSIHSRVGSTATFPWGGFSPGNGIFTIGSTANAGGGIGHMAGTLMGVNVESAGGVGVRVGAGARGAGAGMFRTRAHLAMFNGGVIGEPVVGMGVRSGNSYSFAERGPEVVLPTSREFSGGGRGYGGGTVAVAPPVVKVFLDGQEWRGIARVEAEGVVVDAFTGAGERGRYNG